MMCRGIEAAVVVNMMSGVTTFSHGWLSLAAAAAAALLLRDNASYKRGFAVSVCRREGQAWDGAGVPCFSLAFFFIYWEPRRDGGTTHAF